MTRRMDSLLQKMDMHVVSRRIGDLLALWMKIQIRPALQCETRVTNNAPDLKELSFE
jgi:hypothetical protein